MDRPFRSALLAPRKARTIHLWTATDVREGGSWKIRVLAAFLKAPPPKN
jgi:hypothetical protein